MASIRYTFEATGADETARVFEAIAKGAATIGQTAREGCFALRELAVHLPKLETREPCTAGHGNETDCDLCRGECIGPLLSA